MMDLVNQFSVFLVNKPGVLAQVTRHIAQEKLNIIAMTMSDSSEHGVLRLVTTDGTRIRKAMASLNLPVTETEVLLITLPNRPGALAEVCQKLADAHINISYAYCTTGARGGKTTGVFKVADVKKAMRILKDKLPKTRDDKKRIRHHVATR